MGLPRKVLNIFHCAAFTLISTYKSIVLELYRNSKELMCNSVDRRFIETGLNTFQWWRAAQCVY